MLSAVYLLALGAGLFWQALGDPGPHAGASFFTWDMFPYYYTWSARHVAVGLTTAGRYVELAPDSGQRFRGGVRQNLTRADLDRTARTLEKLVAAQLQQGARLASRLAGTPGAPGERERIARVWLLEEYWPEKHNLPDGAYEADWGPRSERRGAWRVLSEFSVPASGAYP